MPRKLTEDVERVTWRLWRDDVALLTAIHGEQPGGLNAYMREVVHLLAERQRAKLAGGSAQADRPPSASPGAP